MCAKKRSSSLPSRKRYNLRGILSTQQVLNKQFINANSFARNFFTVSIVASTNDGTLTAQIYDVYANKVIQSQDNVANINLDVTIPCSGYYEIQVSRYRTSIYEIFLSQATANVHVATHTTEQVLTQEYRDVTVYPHKDLQTPSIAIMIAGIGVGILSVTQNESKNLTTKSSSENILSGS